MSIKGIIIEKFAKWYVGGVPFESMKRTVAIVSDLELTNKQKKAKAISEIEKLGYALGDFLLGIGIELALGYLKAQAK
jgi:hypothetical protein